MQRILDLDLDFFAHGAIHWPGEDAGRRDPDEVLPWTVEESIGFLHDRCGLSGPLPGAAVEHHGEVFCRWRDAIAVGRLVPPSMSPTSTRTPTWGRGTLGSSTCLLSSCSHRQKGGATPPKRYGGLTDGNYLSFAVACRWLSGLVFVFSEGRLEDIPPLAMEGFDARASHIELAAVTEGEMFRHAGRMQHARVEHFEPRVPFALVPRADFSRGACVRLRVPGALAELHVDRGRRGLRPDPISVH